MSYRTHVFDCDGVLLDSNGAKSAAFYDVALPYGVREAEALVEFHRSAGSTGRRARWEYFFRSIVCRHPHPGELEDLLDRTTRRVRSRAPYPLVPGVRAYLESLTGDRIVVSGVEKAELSELLALHGLAEQFDAVYGSPPDKATLLAALVERGDIGLPATYYGDTFEDYQAASGAGLDFVFVHGCSEQDFARLPAGIPVIADFLPTEAVPA